MTSTNLDSIIEQTGTTLRQAWSAWGKVDQDVLTHLINPSFLGGPRWPSMRQAFAVARRDDAVLVASDGLSDPFDDLDEGEENTNGFKMEVFAFTDDPLDEIPGSYLFDLVWQMSQQVADHGQIAELLDELGLLSTELYDVHIPEEHQSRFVNDAGRVGVLVGIDHEPLPHSVAGPLSPIRLASLKLLTLEELAFIVDGGEAARRDLAARFVARGGPQLSSLRRASVV